MPCSTIRFCRGESSWYGTSIGTPVWAENAASICCDVGETARPARRAARPWRASASDRAAARPGSRRSACPSPSQAGHQPSELLNEKLCGLSVSKLRPHFSQARCWLWTRTGQRGSGTSSCGWATWTTPLPSASAFSMLPAIRERCVAADRRSDRSRLRPRACGGGRSSAAVSSEWVSPSIRTRT